LDASTFEKFEALEKKQLDIFFARLSNRIGVEGGDEGSPGAGLAELESMEGWAEYAAERDRRVKERDRQIEDERRAAEHKRRFEYMPNALDRAGVPLRLARKISSPESAIVDTPALLSVRAWLKTDSWCLVLGGTFGVGKSHAAAVAVRDRYYDTGIYSRCWWSAAEIARAGNYDREAFEEITRGFLVIDDLGAEYGDRSGSFLSQLGDIINERQSNERKTIITTNLDASPFKARYGDRIIERIREGGVFEGVGGPNLRRAS
jgi:DNA replication protein DnaC